MTTLAPCLLFEQLFLKRLPEDIHIQLVDSKIEDHRQLAKPADTLWSSREMESNTNAVQRRPQKTKDKTLASSPDKAARQCRQLGAWSENEQADRQ